MAYSTNWQIVSPQLVGWQPINQTSTTKQHDLGTRVEAIDRGSNGNGQGTFVYAKGLDDTVAGSWVLFNEDDWSTSLLVANDIGNVGIAMSACVSGSYGWYQVRGKAVGAALTGYADNANVIATSTAGSVDDALVAGDRVHRAKGASAVGGPATGMAEFEINFPEVDDALASGAGA
jgi:hypothetical protein